MNENARRARLCLGAALVQALFLGETMVAHRQLPSPASPYVWGLLGTGCALCVVLAAWFHRRSR
jgi:hypothetical protein